MLYLPLFLIEIIILYLISKKLTNNLANIFYKITRNKKTTIYALAIIFLPGTFIHEASHFLAALLLLVPVGKLELLPEIVEGGAKLGSVQIAKTDPLRKFLIGIAPTIFGVLILSGVIFWFTNYPGINNTIKYILVGYIAFELGNTMFSSKKDMEGAVKLFISLAVIFTIIYFLVQKFNIALPQITASQIFTIEIIQILQKLTIYLLIPIIIDLSSLAVFSLMK